MASTGCWKCLLRPSTSSASYGISNLSIRPQPLAAFSTTTAMCYPPKPAAGGKKSPAARAKPTKSGKTLKIKKKAFVKTGKPPAPGERKAGRKRIVLSNTNAIEVASLVDMNSELMLDSQQVTKVLGIPGAVVDQLRAVEAFKTTQGWELFRRPAMLIREESVQIAKLLRKAQDSKTTSVTILDGDRGTGKSMMLLQTLATAFINNWIVVNFPEAQDMTFGVTDYAPVPNTEPQQYSQNAYAAKLLGQIIKANQLTLSNLKLSREHDLPIPIAKDITVYELADLGAKDAEIAWPIFQAVWTEITATGRPPVLFAVDGLEHFMELSRYRNPDFELIHAHDLSFVKLFVDYLSGVKKLPNGGAVLGATTKGNRPKSYTIEIASQQKAYKNEISKDEHGAQTAEYPEIDPYKKIDRRAYESLNHAGLIKLKGLSRDEARGLMEYWAASGVMRQRVDEKTLTEKWTVAGNGVIGEIQRNALWMRI